MALIQFANTLWFGAGEIKRLPRELGRLRVTRPLICTDRGIVGAGLLDRLRVALPDDMPVTVFDETPANPTEAAVRAALASYRAEGCDGLLAIGGGSPIDLAKAVNVLLRHDAPLADYETAKRDRIPIGPLGPLVAVPTTAGTGSEVSVGSILVTEDGRKTTISGTALIPDVAICDPEFTLALPPLLTAATGMDAVTHCIEAVLSPLQNPIADAIGLDGLERAIRRGALERAVADGVDIEARSEMMMAATEGALAFTKGLGAVHSMSHAAGRIAAFNLHHGTLNAVILPTVLRFNAPAVREKMDRIAAACGLASGAKLPGAIEELKSRLGLPASLAAMGVSAGHLPDLVHHALSDVSTATNPVRVTEADFRTLFETLL